MEDEEKEEPAEPAGPTVTVSLGELWKMHPRILREQKTTAPGSRLLTPEEREYGIKD